MSEEILNGGDAADTSTDGATNEIDLSSVPDQLPTEDVKGLKSAFEKQKQATQSAKKQLDDLRSMLNNKSPEEIQSALKELQEAREREEQLQLLRAEAETQVKKDREELELRHRKEITALKTQLADKERSDVYMRLFTENGGVQNEWDTFNLVASRYWDYDPEKKAIIRFKKPDGTTLFAESGDGVKEATAKDFVLEIQNGTYGNALSQCFAPLNQSSGSGLPTTGTYGSEQYLIFYSHSDYEKAVTSKDPKVRDMIRFGKFEKRY